MDMEGHWILPAMVAAGILGGMAWAAIPAFLRNRLGVSEILSSLMLNYVAIQVLYYLMRGPWKDPMGFNFPQTAMFSSSQTLPFVVPGTLIHLGIPVALALALAVWFLIARTVAGFQVRVVGLSPQAARYGGFREARVVWLCMALGGGMAGSPASSRRPDRSGRWCRAFPSATASPPSSSPFSAGFIPSASCSPPSCWR